MDGFPNIGAAEKQPSEPHEFDAALAEYLTAEAWSERQFPPPIRLLGDLVTTTTRAFLIGATGLGKTMLGVALAAGMASGQGFLDWRCDRPVRVLYVDGEMPAELVKARAIDAMRRLGDARLAGNLFFYAADSGEEAAKLFPHLGMLQPLNTDDGQSFILGLIEALGGVDCVIFDNVMSLVAGDQKDEVPWSETLPLIAELTRRQIGQIWLDHAGHNTARQYGSSTKAWRFDAVGVMTELPEDQRGPKVTGFKLSFDAPGKARRRSPANWQEFAPRTITLVDDVWSSDQAERQGAKTRALGRVRPDRQRYHKALIDALVSAAVKPGTTTLAAWEAECINQGLVDAPTATSKDRSRLAKFRTARSELVAANWIGVNGDQVSDLTQIYRPGMFGKKAA